ncbi:hypothetical protein CsSME_00006740 [Camellia sinensis var. sinensis]
MTGGQNGCQHPLYMLLMKLNAPTAAAPVEPSLTDSLDYQPVVPGISDHRTGQFTSCPKKNKLRIGESSAFFTYVKSSMPKSNTQGVAPDDEIATRDLSTEIKLNARVGQAGNDTQDCENEEAQESHFQGDDFPGSSSNPDSLCMERSSTPPVLMEFPQQNNSKMEEFAQLHMHLNNEFHGDVSGFHAHTAYPYYISGVMNQVMMSSAQMHQNNLQDLPNHMLPQYGHIPPHCRPHVQGMASFPYYHPVSIYTQPGQMPATRQWPSHGSPSANEGKISKVDRREAALMKFRQKRKERCFDKKVRYVNRKRLAERRPRVRGQFVRKMNGINVDLNGQPASTDFDEDEEEDDEEEQCS